MKHLLCVILCLSVFIELFAQVSVRTSNSTGRYEVGETVSFMVTATTAGTANYVIRYDEVATPIQSGTVPVQPGVEIPINYNTNESSHVICQVSLGNDFGQAGAAIGCFDLEPVEDKPADFKSFWNNLIGQVNGIPLDPIITPHSSTEYSTSYKISLSNIEGKRTYGYMSIPVGDGPFPAVITFPPFGTDPSIVVPENVFSEWNNCISISLSIHNVDVEQEDPNAYLGEVITDRNQIYFKHGILGGVRAIDYLMTRPDFDQTNVCSYGVSQGGGLAIVFAGVDERVDVLMATNPSLCEHAGLHHERASGFPFYVNKSRGEDGTAAHEELTVAETKYYDGVHAASFFNGPALMSVSYLDNIAPAGPTFKAFNQMQNNFKVMIHAPKLGHANANQFWEDKFRLLNNVWPEETANQPFPWAISETGHSINAGADKTIIGMTTTLTGTVEKDSAPITNWPMKWEKISGPGNVAFSNATGLSTGVSFDENGIYVLKFSADDLTTFADEDVYYTMEDYTTVEVSGIISSNENINLAAPKINLSPNPVQAELNIEISNAQNSEDALVKIYNQLGQLIQTKTINFIQNNQIVTLNTSNFENGLFYLTLESDGKLATKSFIIAH